MCSISRKLYASMSSTEEAATINIAKANTFEMCLARAYDDDLLVIGVQTCIQQMKTLWKVPLAPFF